MVFDGLEAHLNLNSPVSYHTKNKNEGASANANGRESTNPPIREAP